MPGTTARPEAEIDQAPAAANLRGQQSASPKPELAEPSVGRADLEAFRDRIGVPETHTVAVARTNVPGLENEKFEGASPSVWDEAKLPRATPGAIRSPSASPRYQDHAEQDVANQFIRKVEALGLTPSDLDGHTLAIHISHPKGVCPVCLWGLHAANPLQASGVLKQLSDIYRGLFIRVTVETEPAIIPRSPVDFTVHNKTLTIGRK